MQKRQKEQKSKKEEEEQRPSGLKKAVHLQDHITKVIQKTPSAEIPKEISLF
jgi:hypothetical protein